MFRGVDYINSDHKLVVSRLKMNLKKIRGKAKPKPDIKRLKEQEIKKEFQIKLSIKFKTLNGDVVDIEKKV